jgi:AraC-like DNA-binding protein/ligand-binding sensor protein
MSSNTTHHDGPPGSAVSRTPKTARVLLKALDVLHTYTSATGSTGCVLDQNYLPIAEMMPEIIDERNICLFCIKYRSRAAKPKSPRDFSSSPCNTIHTNAVQKACHYGGSYTYICDLGFMFWTSPIFREGRFSGALLGSGFLGIEPEETLRAMMTMSEGAVQEETIRESLACFSRADSGRIKALAELFLTCAQSLSEAGKDYHETLRRRATQQSVIAGQIALLREQHPEGGPLPGYPLDKERMLLTALRRGDSEAGKKALDELLGVLFYANPDHFNYIRFRAIELVVLLSRIAIAPGSGDTVLLETNNRYLKQIQEVENVAELTDALHSIVETLAERIFSFQGVRHAAALQKAERYIHENFTRKISLNEIAEISGLSAPYFSTIFREEMGENLSSYLNRLRVERAGRLLVETSQSLTEIAGACGFEDQSWFSKIFKSYTGTSPGKYRSQGGRVIPDVRDSDFSDSYRSMTKGDSPKPEPETEGEE